MTAIWSVDTEAFYQNAVKVRNNQSLMAVVKNNAYHYGLEFAVKEFLKAGMRGLYVIHILIYTVAILISVNVNIFMYFTAMRC